MTATLTTFIPTALADRQVHLGAGALTLAAAAGFGGMATLLARAPCSRRTA